MRYSYFSTDRAGRTQYLFKSIYNNQSIARVKGGGGIGLYILIYNPVRGTIEWYWENKYNKIKHVSEHKNYKDIDWISVIDDMKKGGNFFDTFITKDFSFMMPDPLQNTINPHPNNLHKIYDKIFACDHILFPEAMLGYYGYSKPDRQGLSLNDALINDIKHLSVDIDYSIDRFKKRKNIIVYKKNIRHMARSWFMGGGEYNKNYYDMISCRINAARKYPTCMQVALDRYKIPYEMWSLDGGDYSAFGFNKKILETYQSDNIVSKLPKKFVHMVDDWVDRYMSEYP